MTTSGQRPYQGYPYVDPPVTDARPIAVASPSNYQPYQGYPYTDPPVTDPRPIAVSSQSNHRPYQGYPYVDPSVTDVPSISADDAARWNHLPRRQVEVRVKREAPTPEFIPLQEPVETALPAKRDSNAAPVVYIDMPQASSSAVADRLNSDGHDFEVIESQSSRPQVSKSDPDAPVVYIDLPEENGSDVAQSRETTPQTEEPAFVQETIFYNPFDNKRIDQAREEDSDDEAENRPQAPPRRPNTLDLNRPGPSGSIFPSSGGMSSLMSKEAEIYGRTDSNGFPASPIPVSQFPEPPPAYAEIDNVSSPVVDREPVVEQPRAASPPRTQVILPQDLSIPTTPIGMPNPDRKYLNCHHCGMRVHTLVIRENGPITHATALSCLVICMLPAVAYIYWTDHLKLKNHYCPNCNKIIGYELPLRSNKIIYVD